MRRTEMAQTLATALFETEAAMDAALEKAALLIAQTSQLRRENGYSALVGHKAVAAITQSIQALGMAREYTMVAHAAFAEAAPHLGVSPARLHGTGTGKPDENPMQPTGAMPDLRIVALAS